MYPCHRAAMGRTQYQAQNNRRRWLSGSSLPGREAASLGSGEAPGAEPLAADGFTLPLGQHAACMVWLFRFYYRSKDPRG